MTEQAEAQRAARAETRPEVRSEVSVHVWTLRERNPEHPDAAAEYMGVHSTAAGAWLGLKAKAVEVADGLLPADWLENADVAQIVTALDNAGWVDTYGVSRMPVAMP